MWGGCFGDLSQDIFQRNQEGSLSTPFWGCEGLPIKGVEWNPSTFLVGEAPTQPTKSIYRGAVPPLRANFAKTWQRTLLDDFAGGRFPQYEMIQNTKGKHLEKLLLQEQNREGRVRPHPYSLRRGLSGTPPIKGFSGTLPYIPKPRRLRGTPQRYTPSVYRGWGRSTPFCNRFFLKFEGAFCIYTISGHFMGKQSWEYWLKSLLDELPGGGGNPICKNTKYCGATSRNFVPLWL